ncbi:MAG: App1 family protein [Methylococcales bacterium]|jgi:phosphatidate phosphatase APP1|nr:App1 family protein [Methylococcales bacterium]MBT7443231.1 App1 family protein [Methylococcales bacterium]
MKYYLILYVMLLTQNAIASALKSDEDLTLFPVYGALQPNQSWQINLHAWVFEKEEKHFFNQQINKQFSKVLELKKNTAQQQLFQQRLAPFLYDSESSKEIKLSLGNISKRFGKTQSNGHLYQQVWLKDQKPGTLMVKSDERPDQQAKVFLIPETGLSIISDVDDTIKISQVTDKKRLLKNTFLEPFKAAKGMAVRYQQWAKQGAAFHYLSASPWQLYTPLAQFIKQFNFPAGTFHMRQIRIKDSSIFSLITSPKHTSPKQYKLQQIEQILQDFPKRTFILVGDSGESDPDIYTAIGIRHPTQIAHIYIRQVTPTAPTKNAKLQVPFTILQP